MGMPPTTFSKLSKLQIVRRAGWRKATKMIGNGPLSRTHEAFNVFLRKGDKEIMNATYTEGVHKWIRRVVTERVDEIVKEKGLNREDFIKPASSPVTKPKKNLSIPMSKDILQAILDDDNL